MTSSVAAIEFHTNIGCCANVCGGDVGVILASARAVGADVLTWRAVFSVRLAGLARGRGLCQIKGGGEDRAVTAVTSPGVPCS